MPGDAVGAEGLRAGRGSWAGGDGQGWGQGHNAGGICEVTHSMLAAGHHQVFGSRAVGWGSSCGTTRHIPAGIGLGLQQCKAGGLSDGHRVVLQFCSSSF